MRRAAVCLVQYIAVSLSLEWPHASTAKPDTLRSDAHELAAV